jgi:uncharacterized protein DUF6610
VADWIALDDLHNWTENYNIGDIPRIKGSLRRFGFNGALRVWHDNVVYAGNNALIALRELCGEGWRPFGKGVQIDDAGHWFVSTIDIRHLSQIEAEAFAAADNQTAALAKHDDKALAALLSRVHREDATLLDAAGYDEGALTAMLEKVALETLQQGATPVDKKAKPNPRVLPLDMIYTLQGADCTCCVAVQAGLLYGIQSGAFRICPYTHELTGRHEVAFVDNDYFNYDHATHLRVVSDYQPKYCTVRDVMTPTQCKEAGITHYTLEQILAWADELAQHARNVIVIPKYDCLDDIPDRFVLGYSIPSSHGGTPLPVEMFKGRRVHLLGGSWKAQLAHMAILGDDVVSVDNNQIALIASQFGQFVDPEGEAKSLAEIGLGALNNPRMVALAISFGSIAAKVNALKKGAADDSQTPQ